MRRLTTVAVVAVAVAGCGGSSPRLPLTKGQYVHQMRAIGASLGRSLDGVSKARTPAQTAAAVTAVQSELHGASRMLGSISPPAGAKAWHAKLVAATGEMADELGALIVRLRNGDGNAVWAVTTIPGFRELLVASDALIARGYPIGR
jgi:hypothetical protein